MLSQLRITCFILVILGSSENVTFPFKGFIIQARTQPSNDLVGSFILINTNKTRLQECQLSGEDPVSNAVS